MSTRLQFVVRLRAFPEIYLSRRATGGDLIHDEEIAERIKNHTPQTNKPPTRQEQLREIFGLDWTWNRRYTDVSKARIFTEIKDIRRAFSIGRRRSKTAKFSEYEIVEYEVKEISALGADQFIDVTKPVPKSRKKKVLTPKVTP